MKSFSLNRDPEMQHNIQPRGDHLTHRMLVDHEALWKEIEIYTIMRITISGKIDKK